MKSVGIDGGTAKAMANAGDPMGGGWLANGQIFFADDDNRMARWISPETGPVRQMPIFYCVLPQLLSDGESMLCGGGAEKAASLRKLSDPQTKHFFRRLGQSGTSGSRMLLGSDFRVIDDKYLVYMSIDGTLSATRIENLDSLTVGKSVALVPMVRRTAYAGGGQFDISGSGTLVYVPGVNAESGRLVRHAINGPAMPLHVESAVHLRFNTGNDGTRLATVVEGIQQQELRIYDLRSGAHETVDSGFYIGGPTWSPDGNRVAYRKSTADQPKHEQLLLRQLNSPEPPRVLIASDVPRGMQPSSYLAENFLLVGVSYVGGVPMVIDPTVSPIKIDSLPLFNLFLSISPDRKWIAYQNQGAKGIVV